MAKRNKPEPIPTKPDAVLPDGLTEGPSVVEATEVDDTHEEGQKEIAAGMNTGATPDNAPDKESLSESDNITREEFESALQTRDETIAMLRSALMRGTLASDEILRAAAQKTYKEVQFQKSYSCCGIASKGNPDLNIIEPYHALPAEIMNIPESEVARLMKRDPDLLETQRERYVSRVRRFRKVIDGEWREAEEEITVDDLLLAVSTKG